MFGRTIKSLVKNGVRDLRKKLSNDDEADETRGGDDADQLTDLLVAGCGSEDEAGLEVLGGVAGDRGGDGNRRADHERRRLAG